MRRQRMGLLVGDHLQAMLDGAQEPVGAHQDRRARRSSIQPPSASASQGRERLAAAQLRMAAAGDELLGLDEEFDFANAAAAELDVVAFDRDDAVTAKGMDLPLHLVDVGKRREVEIFAPDEGRELARAARSPATRSPAQTRALIMAARSQLLAAALVIVERRRHRDRDLGRGRIGTQPHIDAKHVAVVRCAPAAAGSSRRVKAAQRKRRVRRPAANAGASRVEKHDEVDVARIIEFARPHLAHGEHDQAASRPPGRRAPASAIMPARAASAQQIAQSPRRPRRRRPPSGRASPASRPTTPPMSASAISRAASAFMTRRSRIASASVVHGGDDPRWCRQGSRRGAASGSDRSRRDEPRRIGAHEVPQIGRRTRRSPPASVRIAGMRRHDARSAARCHPRARRSRRAIRRTRARPPSSASARAAIDPRRQAPRIRRPECTVTPPVAAG